MDFGLQEFFAFRYSYPYLLGSPFGLLYEKINNNKLNTIT